MVVSVPHWDTTINIGNLTAIGAFILTLIGMHMQNRKTQLDAIKQLADLNIKVNMMWEVFKLTLKDGK